MIGALSNYKQSALIKEKLVFFLPDLPLCPVELRQTLSGFTVHDLAWLSAPSPPFQLYLAAII